VVLSSSALLNNFLVYNSSRDVNIFYLLFSIIGVVGSISAASNKNYGRWILVIFFGLQTVFIYGESFRLVFNPGISFTFKNLSGKGTPEQLLQNPHGFGINLLAIILCILCYFWLRPLDSNSFPTEE
jgi:hypothetical protein